MLKTLKRIIMMLEKITFKDQNSSIRDLIKQIKNGFKLQNLSIDEIENLSDSEKLEFIDSIILQPDYQREYRYSIPDESLLVESLLLSIPIPPIFLANDRYNGIQVLNVVDGQHRLTAFYRYLNDEYALKDLKIRDDINGKIYSKLHIDIKSKLISSTIQQIIFKEFPGRDIELEIFNRYNKGTKPLTPQEIRHAIYGSKTNKFVNQFSSILFNRIENKSYIDFNVEEIVKLNTVYNVTEDRFLKKKIQESIFVILSILEYGIQDQNKKSPEYAASYMEEKTNNEDELKKLERELDLSREKNSSKTEIILLEKKQKDQETLINDNFKKIKDRFFIFNKFIILISKEIQFPFSRELYGISSRNYKFQISIAMILAGLTHKFIINNKKIDELKDIKSVIKYIEETLLDSYLEDKNYNASSTNVTEMKALIEKIELTRLFN